MAKASQMVFKSTVVTTSFGHDEAEAQILQFCHGYLSNSAMTMPSRKFFDLRREWYNPIWWS